jgi:myb proto-oncogene protein
LLRWFRVARINSVVSDGWRLLTTSVRNPLARVPHREWKPKEDAKLIKAVKKHGKDWAAVAALFSGRTKPTKAQCRDRWRKQMGPTSIDQTYSGPAVVETRNKGPWKPEEDSKLIEGIMEHGLHWVAVAALIPGRTNLQCRGRWFKALDPDNTRNKGPWKPEEDAKLIKAVKKHGKNWVAVATLVPDRANNQCSTRWRSHLDPTIDRTTGRPDVRVYGHRRKMQSWWMQ